MMMNRMMMAPPMCPLSAPVRFAASSDMPEKISRNSDSPLGSHFERKIKEQIAQNLDGFAERLGAYLAKQAKKGMDSAVRAERVFTPKAPLNPEFNQAMVQTMMIKYPEIEESFKRELESSGLPVPTDLVSTLSPMVAPALLAERSSVSETILEKSLKLLASPEKVARRANQQLVGWLGIGGLDDKNKDGLGLVFLTGPMQMLLLKLKKAAQGNG